MNVAEGRHPGRRERFPRGRSFGPTEDPGPGERRDAHGFAQLQSYHDIGSMWGPLKQKKKKVMRPIIFNETWLSSEAGRADEAATPSGILTSSPVGPEEGKRRFNGRRPDALVFRVTPDARRDLGRASLTECL